MPKETPNDPKTSSEESFVSSVSNTKSEKPHRLKQTPSELTKEIIDNVPIFDGKTNKLNQFINTIESITNLYQILEVQIVSLQTRGKLHEIITHILEDDTEAGWTGIKRKLTSNYRTMKSRKDAGIQFKNISMKESKTVGEYLARARTLFKAKLRYTAQWTTEYDPSDMWNVINGLRPINLKTYILKKIANYKSYSVLTTSKKNVRRPITWMADTPIKHRTQVKWTKYVNGRKHPWRTHRNKLSKWRSMKSTKGMADNTKTASRGTKDWQVTDSKVTDSIPIKMADSQATALITHGNSCWDIKALQ